MTVEEMQAVILKAIDKHGLVSISEAMQEVGEEAKGELTWEAMDNVIYWVHMSRPFTEALSQLKRSGVIELQPMSRLDLLVCGCHLSLPVVRRVQKSYAKPYWLPVWLRRLKESYAGTRS